MSRAFVLALVLLLITTIRAGAQTVPQCPTPNPNLFAGVVGHPFYPGCPLTAESLNRMPILSGASPVNGNVTSFAVVPGVSLAIKDSGVLASSIAGFAVSNNEALEALTGIVAGAVVYRAGFNSPGDGGGAYYSFSTANCSLNAGAGNDGSQVAPTSGGGCWNIVLQGFYDLRIWGAVCDGSTDDNVPITTALVSGLPIIWPNAICRSSTVITIPDNGVIFGASYLPGVVPPSGSVLQCDATISGPCVIGSNNDSKPVHIQNLTISRGAGTVPINGECLKLNGSQEGYIADVECYNHAQGFEVDSNGTTGFYNRFQRILTCKISDAHFIINTAPGIYVEDSNFGCNGSNDVNTNDFVRITGNWDSTAGTIHISNTQLNQGNGTAVCAFDFKSFTGTTNQILDFAFDGGHVETAQNFLCSDSSAKSISTSHFSNFWTLGGWGGGNHAFNLNSATNLHYVSFNNVTFQAWTDAALAPASGVSLQDLRITGSSFISTPLSITAQSGTQSTMALSGNQYGNLTLGGTWDLGSVAGTNFAGSVLTTTGLSNTVALNLPSFSLRSCTLALSFGGGSTGLTFSVNQCKWSQVGSQVTVTFNIALSAKGSSTGVAAIGLTGPPLAGPNFGLASSPLFYSGMSSITSGVFAVGSSSTNSLGLYQPNGTTAQTQLTDANFTNTSGLIGTVTYTLGS